MNSPVKIERIVIFNLDSFTSCEGIQKIIDKLRDRIVLVCESKRFGGKYGSFLHQCMKNFKRSGFDFVTYQGLNLIWYKVFVFIADILSLFGRRKKIFTLRQLAKKYNIPVISTTEINDSGVVEKIQQYQPDLIISFYFDHVIRESILKIPKFDIVNVHTAMLPECKGPLPIFCSIVNDVEGGITIHSIQNEKLDVGDVYVQNEYRLNGNKSVLTIDHDSMNVGADMLIDFIDSLDNGSFSKTQQLSGGFYDGLPDRERLKILKDKKVQLFNLKEFIGYF